MLTDIKPYCCKVFCTFLVTLYCRNLSDDGEFCANAVFTATHLKDQLNAHIQHGRMLSMLLTAAALNAQHKASEQSIIIAQDLTLGEENNKIKAIIIQWLLYNRLIIHCFDSFMVQAGERGREAVDILCSPNGSLFVKSSVHSAKATGNKTLPELVHKTREPVMYHFGSAVDPKGGSIMV